jgi:DNA-3-methyladenine glycosylase II
MAQTGLTQTRIIKREREQRTAEAVAHLTARDPHLARAHEAGGPFHDRSRKQGFETLVLLVVEQQLSLASAAAIMGRVRGAVVPFKPETLLSMSDQRLRGLGLSGAKVKYCRALAEAFADGSLKPARLSRLDDAAVTEELTKVKGIGPWTAEIYLLTALGRRDVLPAGDLALQVAAQHLYGLPERPDRNGLIEMGEGWRPYRSVAARILWQYYRALKGREVAP